jgi:hypothetical protein
VALVTTDVSEEYITSIIRGESISELGTTLAVTSNQVPSLLILSTQMMEVILGSYKSHTTSHHKREHSSSRLTV